MITQPEIKKKIDEVHIRTLYYEKEVKASLKEMAEFGYSLAEDTIKQLTHTNGVLAEGYKRQEAELSKRDSLLDEMAEALRDACKSSYFSGSQVEKAESVLSKYNSLKGEKG